MAHARTKVIQRPSKNPFPSINFEEFKCFICKKYLSVAPIFVYTDNQQTDRNLCGRCVVPPEEYRVMVRNKSFETLAKYLKFPCSVSNVCKESLNWDEVDQHEKSCNLREVVCRLCLGSHQVVHTVTHFRQNHPENLFDMTNMILSEGMLHNPSIRPVTNLIVQPNLTCFAHINVNGNLCIRMEPVSPPKVPHVFNVIFSTRNNVIHYKNRPIESVDNYDQLKCHEFDINRILDIFMTDTTEFKIELELMEEGNSVSGKKDEVKLQKLPKNIEALVDELTGAVECNICEVPAKGMIQQCIAGHSICDTCKFRLTRCPTCQRMYEGTRNYALEHVASLLAKHGVV